MAILQGDKADRERKVIESIIYIYIYIYIKLTLDGNLLLS